MCLVCSFAEDYSKNKLQIRPYIVFLPLKGRSRKSVYLWEFLLALLADDDSNEWIHWIAKDRRVFQIKDVDEVAKLWGMMKEKPEMNKETFLRSLRYYYTINVLRKV